MKRLTLVWLVCLSFTGCAGMTAKDHTMPTVHAAWTDHAIGMDGRLDEPAWQQAPAYELALSRPATDAGQTPQEGGSFRLLWDDTHLYLGVTLTDSDVVQEDDRDQQHHYQTGDVLELFLKPADKPYYWELYATPNGCKTAFFYPGRGRLGLPSNLEYDSGLRVAVHVDGTLNNWRDRDRQWSAEMAIPREELAQQGVALVPAAAWRVLVGRYNYSAYLPNMELSMYPPLPAASFHMHEHWAELTLEPAEKP